jgi:hypothetical protein
MTTPDAEFRPQGAPDASARSSDVGSYRSDQSTDVITKTFFMAKDSHRIDASSFRDHVLDHGLPSSGGTSGAVLTGDRQHHGSRRPMASLASFLLLV